MNACIGVQWDIFSSRKRGFMGCWIVESRVSGFKSRSGQIVYFHGVKNKALNIRDW